MKNLIHIEITQEQWNNFITNNTPLPFPDVPMDLILDLEGCIVNTVNDLERLFTSAEYLDNEGFAMVVVSHQFEYEDLPEEIPIVPTLQEAKDFIELERIQRELGI